MPGDTRRDFIASRAALTPANVEELWSLADLGPSYSGPLVLGERVFTTETVDEQYETVRALDRATGRELWRAS